MPEPKDVLDQVKDAVAAADVPVPSDPAKEESPDGVKPEGQKPTEEPAIVADPIVEKQPVKESSKLEEQINNLTKALQQEREEKRKEKEDFEKKLEESTSFISKLKNSFSEPKEEVQPEVESKPITLADLENYFLEKESKKQKESKEEEAKIAILKEVDEMTKTWNGENGKPKYDDKEVLEWQQKNSKLYLSPKEAFEIMNRESIMDWEIKQKLSKKPEAPMSELPGGRVDHEKEINFKDEEVVKKLVFEALTNADAEI